MADPAPDPTTESKVPVKVEAPAEAPAATDATDAKETKDSSEKVVGSAAMRPIFLGNLKPNYQADDIKAIFQKPILPPGQEGSVQPLTVERLDQKRGYCFVFLKDATTAADKDNAERFVAAISGMEVENVSSALRAECARGDGRVKRKEDDRRKNIKPSDTLFVVNFQEETTSREDLQMLFEPFGELVRIDLKKNYAFVQFKTIEEATKAKDETNGGKLEQSVLTVEYVAQERNRNRNNNRGGGRRGGRYNDRRDDRRYRDDRHRDDRRGNGGYRGGDKGEPMGYRGGDRDYHDSRGGYDDRGRRDDYRRDRSPYGSPGRGDYRRRSRSRSRSPPRGDYRRDDRGGYSRSPPRGRYDDYRGGGGRYDDQPRGRSPEPYRGNDRGRDDRGYRG